VKFAFILEEKVAFSVSALCRLMEVSTSGFYASQGRSASAHARLDDELVQKVTAAHQASKQRYGSPRVHADLKAAGQRVGRKRVARIMQEKKLVARAHRWSCAWPSESRCADQGLLSNQAARLQRRRS
jgi:putative transposase